MAFHSNSQAQASSSRTPYSAASSNGDYRTSTSNTNRMPGFLTDRGPSFDIFAWHQSYHNCQCYFLDRSQHDPMVQAVALLVNIRLPFQWANNPVNSSDRYSPGATPGGSPYGRHPGPGPQRTSWVSLIPYIRRLVATGFDTDGIMHGFFGDDWRGGIADLQECERRNFLFTAKSVGWAKVKYQYDMNQDEQIPFIRPLQNVKIEEIESAEKEWSKWLAMEDWMVGPRSPDINMAAESRGNSV